jgi:peptidyl-prolyl cis-trans isomerase B (cyclophilin B)
MSKTIILLAITVVFATFIVGCTPKEPVEEVEEVIEETVPEEEPVVLSDEAKTLPSGTLVAVMETNKGVVEWELFVEDTPNTVANFTKLCGDKFYDGIEFHRVVKGFIVQAGDPTFNGIGGDPGLYIDEEPDKAKCVRGAVSMARLADAEGNYAETSGTQFFIVIGNAAHLDPDFCVFGNVVSGMDVVDTILVGTDIERLRVVTVEG